MPGVTARSGMEARQEKPTANCMQNEDQDVPRAGNARLELMRRTKQVAASLGRGTWRRGAGGPQPAPCEGEMRCLVTEAALGKGGGLKDTPRKKW